LHLEFEGKGRGQFCVVQDDIVEHQALQVFASLEKFCLVIEVT
jgi:hypothetical protein